MKKFAKLLTVTALGACLLLAAGCGGDKKDEKKADTKAPVKIGVTAGPHAEIMDNVKKLAAKEGLQVEVVEFPDFVTPNVALAQGDLFANSMQHAPYLAATLKKEPKFQLVEVFKTVSFPMAVYSAKFKKGDAIPDGALIGIPNDPSNGARALMVLHDTGFLKIKDPKDVTSSVASIVDNPHKYRIQEIDAASLPKALPDVDLGVINVNYALVAKMDPSRDALYIEDPNNPFVCIFVTTKANEKDPRIAVLQKVYQSAENKKFIADHFKGTITCGF